MEMINTLCFLVYWTVSVTTMASCPLTPKVDPYTGQYPMYVTSCLVIHYKTTEKNMERHFETMAEANQFVSDAPEHLDLKIVESCHNNILDQSKELDE